MFLYRLTVFLFKILSKPLFHLKIEGQENLPQQGGFILAANHASSLDPFMIMVAIPRYIRWTVIYEYYDQRHLRWMLKGLRFIRVKNNLPKEVFRALGQGEVIGIFPEGRRSWDGQLGQAQRGVAALARRTASPVVPLAVIGTFAALPRTGKRLKFCPVTVRIGQPLFFANPETKHEDGEKLDQENTQKIMRRIAELLQQG